MPRRKPRQPAAAGAARRTQAARPITLPPVLHAMGIDPSKRVEWRAGIGAAPAATAQREGQIAAAFVAEPFATPMAARGAWRLLTMNNSGPMLDDFCCSLVMPAALVRSDRTKAAAITRAAMRGNAWAEVNKAAAAQVDLGQVNASVDDNVRAIETVSFRPAVAAARQNTLDMLMHARETGFLDPGTEVMGVINRIFVPVTGESPVGAPRGLPRTGGAAGVPPWLLGTGAALAALGSILLQRRGVAQR